MNTLNPEQRRAYDKILQEHKNVFITGSAGTGKSHLLKVIVDDLKNIYDVSEIAVTAMTGIASVNINGRTLHSFAGLGLDFKSKPTMDTIMRWRNTKILIIDEVSMLTADLFKNLYEFIKRYKIQIICFGDFFQLPPVEGKACFTCNVWKNLGFLENTIVLTTIIRQQDQEFIKVLNEIRIDNISDNSIDYLTNLDIMNKPVPNDDTITKLYALNKDVNAENLEKLDKIDSPLVINIGIDTLTINKQRASLSQAADFLLKKLDKKIPKKIELKIGARVMLTRNKPDGLLVNGSMGTIIRFEPYGKFNLPVVKFDNPNVTQIVDLVEFEVSYKQYKLTRKQIPIKLAWSLTIHNSQGLTLEKVLATLHGSFATGQIYTVLSRVRDPKNLYIDNIDIIIHCNKACEYSKKYYRIIDKLAST